MKAAITAMLCALLIFITLPQVFIHMAGGRIWGTLFFLFMTFASLSTVIAVFECLIGGLIDEFGWRRLRTTALVGGAVAVLSLPTVFGFNLWSHVQPMAGKTILDFEDFVFSQFWLPLGALATCFFCCWPFGFGWQGFRDEASAGAGWGLPGSLRPYVRYLLPFVLLGILVGGL